ncbi:MAG: adenylyl-sulfate kinase [Proteobacteria bacterium]|nr:adenylyl-sulfate kinase [Pseudomonadota bacterium]MBU1638991.1 adenylyl-sulfate kinase [Pseudomonadota bacterium]
MRKEVTLTTLATEVLSHNAKPNRRSNIEYLSARKNDSGLKTKRRATNVVWQKTSVARSHREELNGHRGVNLWFTGLSGSGKSTLANSVESRLHQLGYRTFLLDGDNLRHGLCSDLGFTREERRENIRRTAEIVKLFIENGVIILSTFVSPFQADREMVRELISEGDFVEIYCHCPLEICEQRDVKGLYKLARAGKIQNYTGISSPYEEPTNADLIVDTGTQTLDESVQTVLKQLQEVRLIGPTQFDDKLNDHFVI